MPAVIPLSPQRIKELLEAHGWELAATDEFNWAFTSMLDLAAAPVLVPHAVDLVPIDIAFSVARKVGFNAYFDMAGPQEARPESAPERKSH